MAVLNTYTDITAADGTEEFVVIHGGSTKNITRSVLFGSGLSTATPAVWNRTSIAANEQAGSWQGTHTLGASNNFSFAGADFRATVAQAGFSATAPRTSGGAAVGVSASAKASGATGTVTALTGVFSTVSNSGLGTVTDAVGYQAAFINSGGGTVDNTYGFLVDAHTIGTTKGYGFYSNLAASGAIRWNFYAAGSAHNAFAGYTRFGGTTTPAYEVDVTGSIYATGSCEFGTITTGATYTLGGGATAAATTKNVNIGTLGVASSTTNVQIGPVSAGAILGVTIGHSGNIANATINAYATTSIWGNLGVGAASAASVKLRAAGTYSNAGGVGYGVSADGTLAGSGVTTNFHGFYSAIDASSNSISGGVRHFSANQGTWTASTIANQYGFIAASTLVGATNNYGFYAAIPADSFNDWNFYATGTAPNLFRGDTRIGGTANPTNALSVTGVVDVSSNIFAAGFIKGATSKLSLGGSGGSPDMQIHSNTTVFADAIWAAANWGTLGTVTAGIYTAKSLSGTLGTYSVANTIVDGTHLGEWRFAGEYYNNTTTVFAQAASFSGRGAGTWAVGSTPTKFVWETTPAGSTTSAVAMVLGPDKSLEVYGNLTVTGTINGAASVQSVIGLSWGGFI